MNPQDVYAKFDKVEKLSYAKYGSYSFACGFYGGLLKDLMLGYISLDSADRQLDGIIKKLEEENVED